MRRSLAFAATAAFVAIVVGRGPTQADLIGPFESEGCDTWGDTYLPGGGINSLTVAEAFDESPCNWVFLGGQYYVYPTWHLEIGPSWSYEPSDGLVEYWASGATIADYYHSACDAGGPCSNAVYNWTHYPDP